MKDDRECDNSNKSVRRCMIYRGNCASHNDNRERGLSFEKAKE